MSFYAFARQLVKLLLKLPYRLRVEGIEQIPEDRGFLLACNHVSDLDPPFLGVACPKQVRYMAKEELFRVPILGFLIRHLGAFPVARGKGDRGAIEKAEQIVREGGVLGIFPEGGRSKDGKLHKAKSGAVVIASQTGGDIVPACIEYGKKRGLRREVTVRFGEPIRNGEIRVDGNQKSELRASNQLLMSRIAVLLGVEAP